MLYTKLVTTILLYFEVPKLQITFVITNKIFIIMIDPFNVNLSTKSTNDKIANNDGDFILFLSKIKLFLLQEKDKLLLWI